MSNAPSTKSQPPQNEQSPQAENLYRIYLQAFIGYLTPRTGVHHFYSNEVLDLRAHGLGLRDAVAVESCGDACNECGEGSLLPLSQDDFEAAMGLKTAASVN